MGTEGWKNNGGGIVVLAMGKTKEHITTKKPLATLTCYFFPSLMLGKALKGCKLINLIGSTTNLTHSNF